MNNFFNPSTNNKTGVINVKDILNKYNKKPLFNYDADTQRQFVNLNDLVQQYGMNQVYPLYALFINTKSRYGDAPILVTKGLFVNTPQHLLDTVKEMLNDSDLIHLINNRKVGFKVYSYEGKNSSGYSVEWVEIQ